MRLPAATSTPRFTTRSGSARCSRERCLPSTGVLTVCSAQRLRVEAAPLGRTLMPAQASIELNLLVWSVALCVLQMLISVITAQGQVGLPPLIGNREGFPELKGIAGRA